jgi:hypothetical protein
MVQLLARRSAKAHNTARVADILNEHRIVYFGFFRHPASAEIGSCLYTLRHRISKDCRVAVTSILDGLHHEYRPKKIAA